MMSRDIDVNAQPRSSGPLYMEIVVQLGEPSRLNPIQTGLFLTFSEGGGGVGGASQAPAPKCNFKTVNAIVT